MELFNMAKIDFNMQQNWGIRCYCKTIYISIIIIIIIIISSSNSNKATTQEQLE